MAGTPTNAALWTNADVYVADYGSTEPTNCYQSWPVAWSAVGLLDGDQGLTMARSEDSTDYFAWGGVLVRSVRSKHKRTVKFTVLEDNDVVFKLLNPGSTRGTSNGLTTSHIKVPTQAEFAIGFEVREGTKVLRRLVKRASVVEVGEVKESETALRTIEFTVALYPEGDGTLYTELSGTVVSS